MTNDLKVKVVVAAPPRRAGGLRCRTGGAIATPRAVGNPQPLKLPHERDESPEAPRDAPARPMRQAYRDLQRGLVDTDRGAEAGRTYQRLKP